MYIEHVLACVAFLAHGYSTTWMGPLLLAWLHDTNSKLTQKWKGNGRNEGAIPPDCRLRHQLERHGISCTFSKQALQYQSLNTILLPLSWQHSMSVHFEPW